MLARVRSVVGNAEDEQVLKDTRIGSAQFCIVALNDDDVNIFTTLMARNINPGIRILARANEPASVDKLYRAGADYQQIIADTERLVSALAVRSGRGSTLIYQGQEINLSAPWPRITVRAAYLRWAGL